MGEWRGTLSRSVSPEFGEWVGLPAHEWEVVSSVFDAAMALAPVLAFIGVHDDVGRKERELIANLLNACRAAEEVEHG